MKRLHIHISVKDISEAVRFYSTLFGSEPTKLKEDYAKWMLEDPKVNFAISDRSQNIGLDHLGIQVESEEELNSITERLTKAEQDIFDQGETECCYAKSVKAWVKDPSGIAWETYQNMGDVEVFGPKKEASGACCAPKKDTASSCC